MTPDRWQRIKEVLTSALEQPAHERRQWVARHCADDSRVRRDVDALLAGDEREPREAPALAAGGAALDDRAVLQTDVAPDRMSADGGAASAGLAVPPGALWGEFILLDELGRGAFGVVHRAWDPALQRDVALKLIDVSRLPPSWGHTLLQEGRMLARVRHANVVGVYGTQRRGSQVGLAMEYIRGRTLAAIMAQQGCLGCHEAASIGVTLCDAVAAVHRTGLVHRDIKAANVMREQGGRIVLMDFGAGHAIEPDRPQASVIAGTPMYMSPEVLQGAAATPASDVYSLGVLLFHLVTGEFPVEGGDVREISAAHRHGRRRELADLRPDLPRTFVDAVEKALEPSRSARPGTATALKRELASAVRVPTLRRPSRAPRPSRQDTPARAAGEWALRVAAGAGGAVLAAFCIGFVMTLEFNAVLGRSDPFASEQLTTYTLLGAKALVAPVAHIALAFLLVNIVTLAARVGGAAMPSLRTRVFALRDSLRRKLVAAGLCDRNTGGQCVCLAGLVGLLAVLVLFSPLFSAYMARADVAPPRDLGVLGPSNKDAHTAMRGGLSVLLVMLGTGLLLVRRMSPRGEPEQDARGQGDRGSLGIVALMVVVVLLQTAPWRVVWGSNFREVMFDGRQCFVIGEHLTDKLVHCPGDAVPRNRIVHGGDSRLVPQDTIGAVFGAYEVVRVRTPTPP